MLNKCEDCGTSFHSVITLNKHLRTAHGECALCDKRIETTNFVEKKCHYTVHGIDLEQDVFFFEHWDSFNAWKIQHEKETFTQYSTDLWNKNKSYLYTLLQCTRSKKKFNEGGQTRAVCPASMSIKRHNDGTIELEVIKTHVGHTLSATITTASSKTSTLVRSNVIKPNTLNLPSTVTIKSEKPHNTKKEEIYTMITVLFKMNHSSKSLFELDFLEKLLEVTISTMAELKNHIDDPKKNDVQIKKRLNLMKVTLEPIDIYDDPNDKIGHESESNKHTPKKRPRILRKKRIKKLQIGDKTSSSENAE